jgi:hypothetical protein
LINKDFINIFNSKTKVIFGLIGWYKRICIFDLLNHFNMKHLKLIAITFCVLLSTSLWAQIPIDQTTGKARYEEVVTVSGTTKDDLFKRLDHWFNTYYKNPSSVIEAKDEATGKMKGKARIDLFTTVPNQPKAKKGLEYYNIEVSVKDGRYKYTIDEIFFYNVPKVPLETWATDKASASEKEWVAQVQTELTKVIESLKATLSQPLGKKVEENW